MEAPPEILVVDSDPQILRILKNILGKEFFTHTATSSETALRIIEENTKLLAILYNYTTPTLSGDVFFRKVRSLTFATRILLGDGNDAAALISALNQGEIAYYLAKPFDTENVLAIVRNAVERSQLSRRMHQEQILLQGLLDNLPYGLAFKNDQGRFIRINSLAAARRGLTIKECLGKTEEELEPAFKHAELRRLNKRLQREERFVETVEIPSIHGNNQSQWFVITRFLLGNAEGETLRPSVLMELDITEQKKLEAALQLSEKLQALGTMAGGVAHDFNNLLTTIIGSLELSYNLLEHQKPNKESIKIIRLLNNALTAARRGAVLTGRLLSFSRKRKLTLQKIEVNQLVEDIQDLLLQTLRMRQATRATGEIHQGRKGPIKVKIKCQKASEILVLTDPVQLELALLNLCINSADAMPDGGTVKISVCHQEIESYLNKQDHRLISGLYVVLTVQDEGVGMTSETLSHIFEPFFTTKETGWGTGLGLAMVYGFVQQSEGDIQVESYVGKGTTFKIYLPAFVEEEKQAQRVIVSHSSKQEHILLVDDDSSVSEVVVGYLQNLGYSVSHISRVAKIAASIELDPIIKLLIVDLSLLQNEPEEFVAIIHKIYPDLKLLFIAGYVDPAVLSSEVLVLNKPFTQGELAQYIGQLLV